MNEYDVIVIGGGPAGYPCVIRCAQHGLKTALIEKEKLGGCCLNTGCIPTKTLFKIARTLQKPKVSGLNVDISFDWEKILNHVKTNVVLRLNTGIGMLLKANGVQYIQADAKVQDCHSVAVNGNLFTAKNIVIATGAKPNVPEIFCNDRRIITTDTIWNLEKLPETFAIIGAGPIGCEFASILSCFGVKITIYEMMEQILPGKDRDIVSVIEKQFSQRGIQIKTGVKIHSTDEIGEEKILWATGRKPDTTAVCEMGLTLLDGGISTDETMRTNFGNIFAAGDVTGKWQLAYVATKEGEIAASNCAGRHETISYQNIPESIFTIPEIGCIGLNEKQAIEKQLNIKTGIFPYQALGKAHAAGETVGVAKVIVDRDSHKLIGVHIAGELATEIIHIASIAMSAGMTIEQMLKAYWCHPVFSEILMEALLVCEGKPMH
ncbi:MAG: dihydrolipoyl dehydrogenase, partial [Candidatus Ratteibacteria bacterium]